MESGTGVTTKIYPTSYDDFQVGDKCYHHYDGNLGGTPFIIKEVREVDFFVYFYNQDYVFTKTDDGWGRPTEWIIIREDTYLQYDPAQQGDENDCI